MITDTTTIDALSQGAEDADPDEAFVVDVGGFEGPLHLLLELARKQKVDLLQVSILDLATQYLGFILEARRQRIDLAADYLLMAAWLAYMKSRLLLPKQEKSEDDELSGDEMATRLAFRLKRLNAMRVAAEELEAGPVLNNVVFLRGAPEQPKVVKHVEYDTTVWHLTQAFGSIRARKEKEAPHTIEKQFVLPLEAARDGLRHVIPTLAEWESLEQIRVRLEPQTTDLPPRSVTASVFPQHWNSLGMAKSICGKTFISHRFFCVDCTITPQEGHMSLLNLQPVDDDEPENAPEDIRQAVRQLSFAYKRSSDTLNAASAPQTAASTPVGGEAPDAAFADAIRRAEAVLFAAGQPLSAEQIGDVLPESVSTADVLMDLKRTYAGRGVQLVEVGGKWRFQTAADLGFLFVEERREQKKLSQAALETLAIIAYGQPVTRAEIEAVRGVAVSKGVIDQLMEAGWVRIKGRRKTPGRPVTLGTTPAFLEHFGLENLDVLPGKAELAAEGLLSDVVPEDFSADGEDEEAIETDFDLTPDGDIEAGFITDFLGEGAELE